MVLLYASYSPYALAVLCATRIFGGVSVALATELPFDWPRRQGLFGALQRLDLEVQKRVLRYFDGIVALTQQLLDDYAPTSSAMILEGAIDPDRLPDDETESNSPSPNEQGPVIMYTGFIDRINGLPLLLEAFQLVKDPSIELHIYGQGPLVRSVREAAKRDSRIFYGGRIPSDQVPRKQRASTCLVLPRPSAQRITRYTFPSKLLEYMASGRPVIITQLPGVPSEYYEYVYLLREETAVGLARVISEACSEDPAALRERGERAKAFVLGHKTWSCQARRVYDFLGTL